MKEGVFMVMMNDDEKKDKVQWNFSLFSHFKKRLYGTKKHATTTLLTICYTTLTKEISGISDGFDI